KRLRKYIIILMLTTFIGGFAFLFLSTYSSFAVVINNNTSEEIRNLTIDYDHTKEEIAVGSIESEDDDVVQIKPKDQATDEFTNSSLLLKYTDDHGEEHEETVLDDFDKETSGDIEVTIEGIADNGELEFEVEEHLAETEEE